MNLTRFFNDLYKKRQLYLFLILPLAYLIIFRYVPIMGAQIAFRDFNPASGIWGSQWVGFKYFLKFINSYMFERVVKNTIVVSLYGLIAGFPISILIALCINTVKSKMLKTSIQNILYIPHFVSVVVIVGILTQFLNPVVGLYGIAGKALSGGMPADILSKSYAFPHLYVWSGIWQNMGWNSILFYAALSNVDLSLHESAMIDGASKFKRVINIDIPSILPTIIIVLILNCGHIMNVGFEKVYLMQNNLNLATSEVISTYVYKIGLTGLGGSDFSYATAIGLFNSIINLLLLSAVNLMARKWSETSLW